MTAPERHRPQRVLAARARDRKVLARSASGGAFAVLAAEVLARGGVVYGCAWDGLTARHVRIADASELPRLQGSKYVRSDVGTTREACVADLRAGREVLYSGTPCQVAALRAHAEHALADDPKALGHLLTCDIICHGTPSARHFDLYLHWLAGRLGRPAGRRGQFPSSRTTASTARITSFAFRDPVCAWGLYYWKCSYELDDRSLEAGGPAESDPYMRAFLKGGNYLRGCYSCPFASPARAGDLTLGDFWGIERSHPDFYDDLGCSVVLVNTGRGAAALARCENDLQTEEATFDQASAANSNLRRPTLMPAEYTAIADEVRAAEKAGDAQRLFGELLPVERGVKSWVRAALGPSGMAALRAVKRQLKR